MSGVLVMSMVYLGEHGGREVHYPGIYQEGREVYIPGYIPTGV